MSATLLPTEAPRSPLGPVIGTGPLLVATDGSEAADAALRAARTFGERLAGGIEVVTVIDSMPIVAPDVQIPINAELETERRADRLARVRGQITRVTGSSGTWPLLLLEGQPAVEILRHARSMRARLLVVGLGRHGMVDRLFGDETALQLLRIGNVPVLAVTPTAKGAPKRIVVAMDFSRGAVRAARAALELAEPDAVLFFVHVIPREMSTSAWETWQHSYAAQVAASFEQMKQQLALPPTMVVETLMMHGDPAAEVLKTATRVEADLIVAGSHGYGFFSRMLLGSVATRIVRGATCSVFAVPHAALDAVELDGYRAGERPATRLERDEWAAQLEEVTRRNAGRRATLEVDDPDLGAQAQENDYPLLGIAYDRHDDRVEIMLGELGAGGAHLSRSIARVSEIDLLRDGQGRDVSLRFQHGAGQTLLTFPR